MQSDFNEFQEESREFEKELEIQLTQSETRNKELQSVNSRLHAENEALKQRLSRLGHMEGHEIAQLQKELSETKIHNERLITSIRALEQSNDDLERAKRALACSVEDYEKRLNDQIEKNVLLEYELDEKEEDITNVEPDDEREIMKAPPVANNANNSNASNKTSNSITTVAVEEPPLPLLSPSTRISALNIVSDLLRKVGALESKLASCRNLVPPGSNSHYASPRLPTSGSTNGMSHIVFNSK